MSNSARGFAPSALLLCIASVASGIGCSSSDEPGGAASEGVTSPPIAATSQYELRTGVATLDALRWDALVVPHEGKDLWLRRDAKSAMSLEVGAVTVIKGRGVLKVAKVTEEGDHLHVEQGGVAFSDFIENGSITIAGASTFDTPFEDPTNDVAIWSPESTEADAEPPAEGSPPGATTPASMIAPFAGAVGSAAAKALFDGSKGVVLDGWHVTKKSMSTGDQSLHYDIELVKDSGVFEARIHLTGNVKNLTTAFNVAVQNHVTTAQTFDVKTSGEAEMSWAVRVNQGGTGYNKILAPGLSYKQQFLVGDVPMVLKVKSNIGIILGASGANTVTTGRVLITYTSDGGVKVSGNQGTGEGTAEGQVFFDKSQGTLATGPAAFGFVATLPKVDLGVGLDGLFVTGAFFSNSMSSVVTAQGAIAGSPCAKVTTKLAGKVGVFADIGDGKGKLGKLLTTGGAQVAKDLLSRTVYEKERVDVTCGLRQH